MQKLTWMKGMQSLSGSLSGCTPHSGLQAQAAPRKPHKSQSPPRHPVPLKTSVGAAQDMDVEGTPLPQPLDKDVLSLIDQLCSQEDFLTQVGRARAVGLGCPGRTSPRTPGAVQRRALLHPTWRCPDLSVSSLVSAESTESTEGVPSFGSSVSFPQAEGLTLCSEGMGSGSQLPAPLAPRAPVLCSQPFLPQPEALLNPQFLEELLSPDPELDLSNLAEELGQQGGLSPTQVST